ncbi:MAG: hypothetical protein ACKVQB_08525, partial [Bacteroidia bacterium]
QDYPWYSPYQFAGNTPIWANDLDGLEPNYPGLLKDYVQILTPTEAATLLTKQQFHIIHFNVIKKFYVENMAAINAAEASGRIGKARFINLLTKQFGGYDCITSMIAANQILFDDFKLNKSSNEGNVVKYNNNLVKWGYAIHNSITDKYKISTNGKRAGDIAISSDFTMSSSLGDNLSSKIGSIEGVYIFNLAMGVDFHGMTIIARNINTVVPDIDILTGLQKTDAGGNLLTKIETKTTFYKADEIGAGWREIGTKTDLDAYIASWHYLNSTEDDGTGTGTRVISSDAINNITEGRQEGTIYQLQRK